MEPDYGSPSYGGPKPGKVTTIATLSLISGIVNIIWGAVLTILVVIGSFGIGIICAPLTILPTVLGIFEILYATRLMADPPRPHPNAQVLAILEICGILYGNILSLVAGILALMYGNDSEVQDYYKRLSQ